MPKVGNNENIDLLNLICNGMRKNNKEEWEVCKYLGFSKTTWYRRAEKPEEFTLKEIRLLRKKFNWTDEEILKVIGGKK